MVLLLLQFCDLLLEKATVVVVDEAHTLKSQKGKLNQAMQLLKTKRRIALTGYPLQNNLDEYYTMMCWVRGGGVGGRIE